MPGHGYRQGHPARLCARIYLLDSGGCGLCFRFTAIFKVEETLTDGIAVGDCPVIQHCNVLHTPPLMYFAQVGLLISAETGKIQVRDRNAARLVVINCTAALK